MLQMLLETSAIYLLVSWWTVIADLTEVLRDIWYKFLFFRLLYTSCFKQHISFLKQFGFYFINVYLYYHYYIFRTTAPKNWIRRSSKRYAHIKLFTSPLYLSCYLDQFLAVIFPCFKLKGFILILYICHFQSLHVFWVIV